MQNSVATSSQNRCNHEHTAQCLPARLVGQLCCNGRQHGTRVVLLLAHSIMVDVMTIFTRKPKRPVYRVRGGGQSNNFSQAGSAMRAFLINWNRGDTVYLTRVSDGAVIAIGEHNEQCH